MGTFEGDFIGKLNQELTYADIGRLVRTAADTEMSLEEQIAVNQFGQDILPADTLLHRFSLLDEADKRERLRHFSYLIWQSKPTDLDIEPAITNSRLKPTYTACVVLRTHRVKVGIAKVIALPVDELAKTYCLLLFLFKQAYQRRFKQEKGNPNKWWYWDLSDNDLVQTLLGNR